MSRILVTGGSGFIGSGLVKALVTAGHRVRVLDDNSRGNPRRLAEVAKDVELIAGDIRNAGGAEFIRCQAFGARSAFCRYQSGVGLRPSPSGTRGL